MARPHLKGARDVNVQTLITFEEDGRLVSMSEAIDRSKSTILRSALIAYLEQYEKAQRQSIRRKDRAEG